jgi:hypothetical protein
MAKSKKTNTEILREMESRWREARMIAAQRSLAEAQHQLADEMELAREQDLPKPKKYDALFKEAFPPDGRPPDHLTDKDVGKSISPFYKKHGVRRPLDRHAIARARGRRK